MNLSNNQKGISLVEVLVSSGLVILGIGIIAGVSVRILKENAKIKQANEAQEIIQLVTTQATSKGGCRSLIGATFNTDPQKSTPLELSINAYTIKKNENISNQLKINDFNIKNTLSNPTNVTVNGLQYKQYIATVNIAVGSINAKPSDAINQSRSIEVPVVVGPGNLNSVYSCGNEIIAEHVCNSTNEMWNPVLKKCVNKLQCRPAGTFTDVGVSGSPPAFQYNIIGSKSNLSSFYDSVQKKYGKLNPNGNIEINPLTGGISCPPEKLPGNPDPNKDYVIGHVTLQDVWKNSVDVDNCGQRVPILKCGKFKCKVEKICVMLDPVKVAKCAIKTSVPLTAGGATLDNASSAIVKSLNNTLSLYLLNQVLKCLQEKTTLEAQMAAVQVTCQRCPASLLGVK